MRDIDQGTVHTATVEADLDFEEIVRHDYRGRGETEEEGFGLVVISDVQVRAFFIELALFDADLARELSRDAKLDQMGTGVIVYFPGWNLAVV